MFAHSSTCHNFPHSPKSVSPFVHTLESLEYVATHVFFPFQLPDVYDGTQEKNHSIARAVCSASCTYGTQVCGTSEQEQWNRVIKMLDNLQASVRSEDIDRDYAISQLQEMQTGDILVFFIRRQDAVIILTKRENSTLWEAFEASPNEDAVQKANGPLNCSYPRSIAEIPNEVFDNPDFRFRFANFLSHPNIDWDLPLPHPAHPQYVYILLNTILESIGRATSITPVTKGGVLKRIRDRVGRSWKLEDESKDVWRRSSLWLLIKVAIQTSVHDSSSYKRFVLFFMCTLANDASNTSLSTDMLSLMSSRILARQKKLGTTTRDWLTEVALKTCARLREILDIRLKELSIRPSTFRNPSPEELARDTQLSLLSSRGYIEHVLEDPTHEPVGPFRPNHRPRGTIDDFLSSNGAFLEEAYKADPDATLYDVERSVELGIDDWVAYVTNVDDACAQLGFLLDKYLMKLYDHTFLFNPEETSLRLLTAIELYVALDKLVVREIPLLADYPPGISTSFLERIILHKATSLHRLSCAYQYLFARHAQSRPGWSVSSDDFTEDSFPVRYYDQSLHLQQLKARIEEDAIGKQANLDLEQQKLAAGVKVSRSPLPTSLRYAKVIVFELQPPVCLRVWRSAAPCILNYSFLVGDLPRKVGPEEGDYLLENVRALRHYSVARHQGPILHVQIHLSYFYPEGSYSPTVRYVVRHPYWNNLSFDVARLSTQRQIRQATRSCRDWDFFFNLRYRRFGFGPDILKQYIDSTSHTCNHVLATQAECPPDLSVDEFSAFAHLRSGGSLQWLNILHGLRCRTLNFRRSEVHFLLAYAACQVGPLDPHTGTWVWHEELQDPSFCGALLAELDSLFMDVGAGSIDAVLMHTISFLITRMLASIPCEIIWDRAVTLLWRVRRKSFGWAQDLSYDLSKAPTNDKRRDLLLHMAIACRSTFDIDPTAHRKLFRSAEDIDAVVCCTIFIHALYPRYMHTVDSYLKLWHRRDSRLSFGLEETLNDEILADPLNYGVDLAVRRIFVSYSPSIQRWKRLEYPDGRWLTCETEVTKSQRLQTVHINLLNGALHVDGRPLNGSLQEIWKYPEFYQIFSDQGFFVTSSSLPGMDFMTLEHKVHFSLRGDYLVVRIKDSETNEILELIPSAMLQEDLPPALVYGHAHWLNLSTKIIEIRPFKELWKQSTEHWRIDCTLGQYNMSRGSMALVDIRSATWTTVLKCFECLNNVDESVLDSWKNSRKDVRDTSVQYNLSADLLITASSHQSPSTSQLSVTLPGYSLSFFVNDRGELESRDFKDMVYDENQCIGTLFGLENFLVLRPNTYIAGTIVPEGLIHRQILIPNGYPKLHVDSNLIRIDILNRDYRFNEADKPLYHAYSVDLELGCLLGDGSFGSTIFLASLHAMTNCHQPDPLTGKTGIQAALCLFQSGRCRSIMKQKVDPDFFQYTEDPRVTTAFKRIHTRHYWDRDTYRLSEVQVIDQEKPQAVTQPRSPENQCCAENIHSTIHGLDSTPVIHPEVSSPQHIFNLAPPSIMTLEHLICIRPAPELPSRITLCLDGILVRVDNPGTLALDQLFSSLQTDSSFKREYLAHLDASSQHVRMHSRITRMAPGWNPIERLKEHYAQCRINYLHCLDILRGSLGPANSHEHILNETGQWPRITIDDLLRYLASTSPIKVLPSWKHCLTRLSLVLLDLQRARRLLRFAMKGLAEELSKELQNEPCDGWSPDKFPDWLLIQIQGNFLIRRAQAETAMEIMSPRSGENAVMQVNMGDGKSSVIIPIAAAALADGTQLVRVVVPKALIAQMFDILVARLGGLTNRPIYHLPFSRNPEYDWRGRVTSLQIEDLSRFMSQCMAERGVVLVQPEHVVSLKLMGIEEQIRSGEFTTELSTFQKSIYKHVSGAMFPRSGSPKGGDPVDKAFQLSAQSSKRSSEGENSKPDDGHPESRSERQWGSLQRWLDSHARDILDESDEILHPRFQLVYTMGPQLHMDGYPARWTITQQVLGLVKKHLYSLSRYAPDAIEYDCDAPGSFPRVQIVRTSDIGQRLISFIAEDVLDGKLPSLNFERVSPILRDAIRSFISDENVLQVPTTVERVEEYAKGSDQSHLWTGLLLLRGLLTSNILLWALTERRWRVNYGRTIQSHGGTNTMLAVPYRAKDMPARDTQFGHPDLTIILTCLSYYYEGLEPRELKECFEILLDQDDPTAEYTLWIKQCEPFSVPVLKLNDINLNPSEQWDNIIYPLFNKNQSAIDFYLSRVVFPREATGFPSKLSGSSWDLAEKRKQLVTGFSGTNDGRWLLPMSIAHHDLDHQKGTNARVLTWLLQPENGSYMVVYDNSEKQRSTRTLLRKIVEQKPEIRVLLDVGSQILDLSNEGVASAWLEISPDAAGAVYFNNKDELIVLTRNGTRLPMLSSPLSQHFERCVVYLDHAHTRGTDINLPVGSRAAVTLGPKVTKDALVQGCMRMRKLGSGHSVMFFVPPEVDRIIRGAVGKTDPDTQVTTVDILSWAIHDTWTDIQQRAPYWAQQGMNHKSTHDAWNQFLSGKLTRKKLMDAWLQREMKSLANLYAPWETKKSLPVLDPEILEHCKELGVLALPKVELEEEQEREVCREREREREMELPPMAEPAEHFLHPDVKSFVRTGLIPSPSLHSAKVFQPVFTMLGRSSAATRDADVWSRRILATADFISTVKPESTRGTIDQYLRPVQWVLTSKREREPVLVLLSSHEVKHLLPDIRTSESVHLHLYAPRTAERMKPSDDLQLYSIPALPLGWTPPWDLIDQLNVFSGQLYLRDHDSYTRLCHFLDVNDTTVRRNLFNIPGSFEEMAIEFAESPLPSVMALLGIRSRGRPFAHTHMGKILQGQLLTKKDFRGRLLHASDGSPIPYEEKTPQDVPLSSDMECDIEPDKGSPSFRQVYKRRVETTEISVSDLESPSKRLRME